MNCDNNIYTLPTINFVGGETQKLAFNVYSYKNKRPFSLVGCTCNFSIVSYTNKSGEPALDKKIDEISGDNVLTVTLDPSDTVDLCGKYIYQIIIRDDASGNVEIPNQGILYITNNINKKFIRE